MKYELEVVNIRLVKEPSWYSEVPLRKTKDAAELMARKFAENEWIYTLDEESFL